jgi:hypothetical protein
MAVDGFQFLFPENPNLQTRDEVPTAVEHSSEKNIEQVLFFYNEDQ